ncbi:type II toxin-antitoxin system RelE family toxin [Klebsiella pneumoniae]|uniref:type II toxin-antitoxin system RelE family toxin n=1 Tax=Klebsiella pneumoniae TaxID=573 RepID=UPI0009BB4586|nr:type II toxin-antitoxin system RelE/ParE family toxin [Klebsiella pneumoniae]SMA48306.1 RelE antibacterial toxin protein [Klebsiella pneumoniae]
MTYKLAFNESALKEWKKLGHTLQVQFKKKLKERLENPRVPASQVEDDIVTVTVIGVGKRENDDIYNATLNRN